MGKSFDALIEFTKTQLRDDEKANIIGPVKPFLEDIIKEAALFEFPMIVEKLIPSTGKNRDEYSRYVGDYFALSKQNNQHLILPYTTTAIEDSMSAIILREIDTNNNYFVVSSIMDKGVQSISVSYAKIDEPRPKVYVEVSNLFSKNFFQGIPQPSNPLQMASCVGKDTIAFVDQLVYLMDPGNFLILKENNSSKKLTSKSNGKKKKREFLRKTVMRPHYICLNEDDTKDFFRNKTKEPRGAHPVRGHLRRFKEDSTYFTKMRGKTRFIKQYFTGEGQITGVNGWNYEVMVKESPTIITPYTNLKKSL